MLVRVTLLGAGRMVAGIEARRLTEASEAYWLVVEAALTSGC